MGPSALKWYIIYYISKVRSILSTEKLEKATNGKFLSIQTAQQNIGVFSYFGMGLEMGEI